MPIAAEIRGSLNVTAVITGLPLNARFVITCFVRMGHLFFLSSKEQSRGFHANSHQ